MNVNTNNITIAKNTPLVNIALLLLENNFSSEREIRKLFCKNTLRYLEAKNILGKTPFVTF